MNEKVLLVIVSGLHPKGLTENAFVKEMMANGTYTFNGRSVAPSYSLPACMSLCQSVPPERHGVLSDTYSIPAMPVQGLVERAFKSGKTTAFYYTKFLLRDIIRGGHLVNAICFNEETNDDSGQKLTDAAIEYIEEEKPELFLIQYTDMERAGKEFGWGSSMYRFYENRQVDCLKKLYDKYKDEYTFVIVSDHAGHKFRYGSDTPEDITVPMFFIGADFEKGKEIDCSILDIAPTVAKIMGFPPVNEWEGSSII